MFGRANKTPDGGRIDKDGKYYTPEQVASYKKGAKAGYKKGCHEGSKYTAKRHGVYVSKRNRLN